MEYKGDGDTTRCTWNNLQRFGEKTRRFRNQRTSGHNADDSIVEMGQNNEKSLREFKSLAVTQIPNS